MKNVDLLKGNITLSLTSLALPIMGMSLIQMAYNLTDIYWIGKLGSGAVASVGTGGIVLWFSMGLITLATLGGQVLVGQNYGAKKYDNAISYAHSSIYIAFTICLILGISYFFFNEFIISIFNLNDITVVNDAKDYLKIAGGFIIFSLMSNLYTKLFSVCGNSKVPFIATTCGLVINIVLDPILIFGYFNLPALGVKGAALATIFAQFIVFSLLILFSFKDKIIFRNINYLSLPKLNYCKEIIKISYPVTFQAIAFPLISMYISRLVAGYSDAAVAVQRIGSQIESISWMTAEGFCVAVNGFIAQNYGANQIERTKIGFNKALRILVIIGIINTIILTCFASNLFGIFLNDTNILPLGVDYLVILGISQLFMCIEIFSSSSLNAFSKTLIPSSINFIFTFLRIPMAIYLSSIIGLNGIWWSITISSIFKGVILFIIITIFMGNLKSKK